MSLTLLDPPSAEPVSLSEARARLRVADASQDDAINHWIQTARARVERDTGRACLAQTWLERRDVWWGEGRLSAFGTRFRLLKPPLIALEAVTVYGLDDAPSEIDPAAFFVDTLSDPGRLVLRPGQSWPLPGRAAAGIGIRFRCGYGDQSDDVPAPLREAILQLTVHLAETNGASALPPGVAALIAPYRPVML